MTAPLPEHAVEAVLFDDAGQVSLRMERILAVPPDRVWTALTQADQVRRWAPYAPERDLDVLGDVALPQAAGGTAAEGPPEPGRVLQLIPLRLLLLSWGDHQLRFDLAPTDDGGTQLTLLHIFDAASEAPDYAAGWHLCLAALQGRLAGADVPAVAGPAARDHGWSELRDQYARLLAAPAAD